MEQTMQKFSLYILLIFNITSLAIHKVETNPFVDDNFTSLSCLRKIKPKLQVNKFIENIADLRLNLLTKFSGKTPAPEFYKKLGREAQTELGIPLLLHAPIYKMDQDYKRKNPDALGTYAADSGTISINIENLEKCSFGVKRDVVFHEGVHRKYRDSTQYVPGIFNPAIFFLLSNESSLLFDPFLHYYDHLKLKEKRADTEGLYATKCSYCVQDRLQIASPYNSKVFNYINAKEIKKISDELGKQKQLCPYHKTWKTACKARY